MIKHFKLNEKGRDYVTGDIHGCFEMLKQCLFDIKFNPICDRLFSLGDLVDRGYHSEDCINWLNEPWFHAVRGNHEQMAIDMFYGNWESDNYLMNGGAWFLGLAHDEQRYYVDMFESLPLIIDVETKNGLVGIVHAEYPTNKWIDKDTVITNSLSDRAFKDACLWSRERFNSKDEGIIDGVHKVIVGHTPVKEPVMLGNTLYIDTGAVFKHKLTIIQL